MPLLADWEEALNTREQWDVVVIGAGPAGSVTAREMARLGARVLLLDRATFPRAKVCGCCLNQATLATLAAIDLEHIVEACGAVPLSRVSLAAGRANATLPLPGGVALSREALDAALIEAAVKAGVEFRPGTLVKWPAEVPPGKITILANGLAGNASPVAPGSRIGAGVVVPDSLAPGFFQPGTIYMATGRGGYVGLVRLEDNRLDIAAAFDATFVKAAGGPGTAAAAILHEAHWPNIPRIESLSWKGTPALTRKPTAIAGPGWFAVGDAAGYVEPFTGEGMAWAIASAAALAPLAVRAVAGWDDRFITDWARTHDRIVGPRQRICRLVARGLRSPFVTRSVIRLASAVPMLSRSFIGALNHPSRTGKGTPA